MSLLLDTTIEISLVLLIALGACAWLRRGSAALRHRVLAAALLCAAVTPLLGLVVPSWRVPLASARGAAAIRQQDRSTDVPITERGALQDASVDAARALTARGTDRESPRRAWTDAVSVVWLGGVAFGLLTLVVGLVRLSWIASRALVVTDREWTSAAQDIARAYGLRAPVLLLRSSHPTLLVTWGLRRPRIIVPDTSAGWDAERIRVVLAHELAHIQRRDWILQLAVQLLLAAHWFNPLVWIAAVRLRQESEQACDDAVIRLGVEGAAYATHLLSLARAFSANRPMWSPAPAIARPSSLERRVRAMLNPRVNRQPATRSASFVTSIALLAITIVIAGFTAAAQTFVTVSGTVVDPQGALLPNVSLVLTNTQSQAKYEVRTSPTGQYEFVGIPPGEFAMVAKLPGFRIIETHIPVTGSNLQRDLTMQVGELQETITVIASPGERSGLSSVNVEAARSAFRDAMARCAASPAVGGAGVGGKIRPPRKLRHVSPVYPEGLKAAGIGGTVNLDALIDADGRVREVTPVENESIDPGLVSAAIDAVNQWEFDGTLLNCVPIEVSMKVSVLFNPQQ